MNDSDDFSFQSSWFEFGEPDPPAAVCSGCKDPIPCIEDVVSPWRCSCGASFVPTLADLSVWLTRHNLAVFLDRKIVLPLSELPLWGMEMWSVVRALSEDPSLSRAVICPN